MSYDKLKKKTPYSNTTVPWERSKGQIERILHDYGVQGTQWTMYKGEEDLKFIVNTNVRGVTKEIMIKVKPPQMFRRKRTSKGLVKTPHKNQSYRLLFYWIKSKLEAVCHGLSTIEQEFLSQINVALTNGKEVTVGEIMASAISMNKLKSLPFIMEKQE